MRVLLAALVAYMPATGWGFLLAGVTGLLVSIVVLAPFTVLGVVVLEAQREKHRHELGTWVRPPDRRMMSHPTRIIDR